MGASCGTVSKLLAIFRHGVLLALVVGVSALLGLLSVAVPALVINEVAEAFGHGLDPDNLMGAILWMFWVWLPLGLGLGFRYVSSDQLKPDGYPRAGLAGLVDRIKAQRL